MEIFFVLFGFAIGIIQLYFWFPKLFPAWIRNKWSIQDSERFIKAANSNNITKKRTQRNLFLPRYYVGEASADVYLGLLGGGLDVFTYKTLSFEYKHEWVPLPEYLVEKKEKWISEQEAEEKLNGKEFFNGPAVRLHSFDLGLYQDDSGEEKKCPNLFFRPTCWYDYSVSNKILDKKILVSGKGESTIRNEYVDESYLLQTRNIDWIRLSNILTVTVVVLTKDLWTLIGKRTRHVDNSSLVYAASAAENMHRWKDEPSNLNDPWSTPKKFTEKGKKVNWDYQPLSSPNPFFTAIRAVDEEISEELSLSISPQDVTFLGIAWNIPSFNPHLYAQIKLDIDMSELYHILDGSRGRDSWESTLIPIKFEPSGDLKDILLNEKWAEVSKGAILRSLVQEYGYKDVDKNLRY